MPVHTWILNFLGTVAAVLAAILLDPTGTVAAIATTVWTQAGVLSSVSAIFATQVAPRFAPLQPYAGTLQIGAVVFGVAFALRQLDRFWDALTERVL